MAKIPAWKLAWKEKFREKMLPHHPRSTDAKVEKILKRISGIRSTMVTRSAKHDVACTITVDELREMIYLAYGTPCRYTSRVLLIDNMVVDHIHPISKGGASTIDNLQVISKFANTMKGSLTEDEFRTLLDWLDDLPEGLRTDISIRLARGLR